MVDVTTQAAITVKKEDRTHIYNCPGNASLGEIFDVLQELKAYVVQRINEAQKSEQTPVKEPSNEVTNG